MKLRLTLALLTVLAALAACSHEPTAPPLVAGTGTVTSYGGKCSGWLIRADSGSTYELTGLDERFQESGIRVRFTLRTHSDRASVCMVGPIADVVSIARL